MNTHVAEKPTEVGEAQATSARIPPAAEVLGYVGGALALAAVIALMAQFWNEIGPWGRVGIAAALAVAGLAGGFAIGRLEAAAAKRLEQFLLAVGVVGVGAACGFATYKIAPNMLQGARIAVVMSKASEWAWFIGFFSAAIVGSVVWRVRPTIMQHLVFGAAVAASSLLVLPLVPIDGPYWGAGAVLLAVAVVWGALGLAEKLPPTNIALALASTGILGSFMLVYSEREIITWWWAGLGTSLLLIVAGAWFKRPVVLGIAAAGAVTYSLLVVTDIFRGTFGAPVVLLLVGVALMVAAVVVAVMVPRMRAHRTADVHATAPMEALSAEKLAVREIPLLAEILGYMGGALSAGSLVALISMFWETLGAVGRIGVPAVAGAIALASALYIGRLGSAAAKRLEQFLLAVGVIGVSAAVGIGVFEVTSGLYGKPSQANDYMDYAGNWGRFAGFLSGTVLGGIVWWFRRSVLPHLVFGLSALMVILTSLGLYPPETLAFWVGGVLTLTFGLVWGGLGLKGWLPPVNTALCIACPAVLFSFQTMARGSMGGPYTWVLWTGLAVAVAMVVASIPLKRGVLLGFGAAGVVLYSVSIVVEQFGGMMAGPIVLLVAGVTFVAMAVLVGVMLPRMRRVA